MGGIKHNKKLFVKTHKEVKQKLLKHFKKATEAISRVQNNEKSFCGR
jgi:hypothetical protein